MTALDTAPPRRRDGRWGDGRRRGRWGLLASLALNVFLVAVIVAHLAAHRGPSHGPGGAGPRIDRMAASLPVADGDRLRAAFAAEAERVDAATAAFRQAQAAVRQALRAEPFDPTVLRAAMAESRAKRLVVEEQLQAVVATAASGMSADGRAKLAEWPRPR
jgi:uncharacterized membrane protein